MMHCMQVSHTNTLAIGGRPALKDVEWCVHDLFSLKAIKTIKT